VAVTLTKREVVRVYSRQAPIYDVWAAVTESRARRRALQLAAVRDGESILEVAVGTGLLFVALLGQNPNGRTEGIDLTEAMLAKARAKAERSSVRNWRLRLGDAYQLDFPASTFDLVMNSYMFDLLPETDFPRVLGEFHRVLKPMGRLVLINLARADTWFYALWDRLYRVKPAWVGGCRGVSVVEPAVRAGFVIKASVRVTQWGFPSELISAAKA
jgi:ubiquinone/menaquinone biosynthesis C-methylase UbiE